MDVNGLRVWQVADAGGFGLSGPDGAASGLSEAGPAEGLYWQADMRLLRLARRQAAPVVSEDPVFAQALALRPSPVADGGGSFAWWDGAEGTLRAAGFAAGAVPLVLPADIPAGVPQPTDLAFGVDDILYAARNDAVVMLDRRGRWRPARVALAGFAAHRLAPIPGGGVWALDRVGGRIAALAGQPLREAGLAPPGPERFGPQDPNPRPPRLRLLRDARLPEGTRGVALAGSPEGRLAVLAWRTADNAMLLVLDGESPGRLVVTRAFALAGLRHPYALAWHGEDRLAVLATDGPAPARQAFVYDLQGVEGTALPGGDIHPLLDPWHGGFCNVLAEVPTYAVAGASVDEPGGIRRLRALSRAGHATGGRVTLGPFDAGRAGAAWHRLYVEAAMPDHSGLCIWAHADDAGVVPAAPGEDTAPDWAPHVLGQANQPGAPAFAWCDDASEVPFHPGLLACPRAPGRAGLFTALLQQVGRQVRRIAGRWLWLHVELTGDGRVTPELAAIRVYGERFSYRDRYLPALYHEPLSGPDADAAGSASPPDFLERFLGLFEGALTVMEGKVAHAWLLTDPSAAPDAALPWLAGWIGVATDDGEAPARLRQRLRAAPWTARLHGTQGGLLAALELATGGVLVTGGQIDPARTVPRPGQVAVANLEDRLLRVLVLGVSDPAGGQGSAVLWGGAVSRGEIVAVEGWRLRRTFATILGADLADEDDPLTLGLAASGNSFVGDSLILGEEARREVLALFGPDLPRGAADRAAVAAFFERLAHRVVVLVRETSRTADRARLLRVAQSESPAHVEVSVLTARQPLIVGAASLVGIDSFLLPEPSPRRVRLGRSAIGGGDVVRGSGWLDPRADGPVAAPPRAVADGPGSIPSGTPFVLSAARSAAGAGRAVARNIWTWV